MITSGIIESALAASRSCDPGNWVDRGLGLAGGSPGPVVDPFGWLASSPAAFLVEHLQPFRNILDALTVDPYAIESYAGEWAGIASSLTAAQQRLGTAVATDTAGWQGAAADAYRRKAAHQGEAIGAAAVVAETVGTVAVTMGQVVAFVRDEVRRLLTELVRMLITWVSEAVFSFGLALPFVVAQAGSAIADWAPKITNVLNRLNDTLRRAETALGGLTNVFAKIMRRLGELPNPVIAAAVPPVIAGPPPPPKIPPPVIPHPPPVIARPHPDPLLPHYQGPPNLPGTPVQARQTGEPTPPPFPTMTPRAGVPATVPMPESGGAAPGSGGYDPGSPGRTTPAAGGSGGPDTSTSGAGPSVSGPTASGPQEQLRAPAGQPVPFPTQASPSASEPNQGGAAAGHQPGRAGGGAATGRRTFSGWTGTPGGPGIPPAPEEETRGQRTRRPASTGPASAAPPRTSPQSSSSPRPTRGRPNPGEQSEDELYEFLGMVLRQGTDDSPAERERSRRHGRAWLNNETQRLWQRIHDSETYLAWLESAGTGQLIDQDTVAGILRGQGTDPAAVLAELLVRNEAAKVTEEYDIAVSFAPAQIEYVEQTVGAARALGLKVFYDRDLSNAWWGRNFILEQRKIYGQLALHFVPFISTEYLASPYPLDGFHQAVMKAVSQQNHYILPVLFGDVAVPAHLLGPHIGYLRAEDHSPTELAAHMKATVDNSRANGHQARDFGTVIHDAHAYIGGDG